LLSHKSEHLIKIEDRGIIQAIAIDSHRHQIKIILTQTPNDH